MTDQRYHCQTCIEFLADYCDGALPREQSDEFEKHLGLCPPCRDYLHSYRETIKAEKKCCCDEVKDKLPKMPDQLVHAILKACGKQK